MNDTFPRAQSGFPLLPFTPRPPATQAILHTFVLSWVVNVEVPIPHNRQLHGQVVDLHSFIEILQPGWGEGRRELGHRFLEGLDVQPGALKSTQG